MRIISLFTVFSLILGTLIFTTSVPTRDAFALNKAQCEVWRRKCVQQCFVTWPDDDKSATGCTMQCLNDFYVCLGRIPTFTGR